MWRSLRLFLGASVLSASLAGWSWSAYSQPVEPAAEPQALVLGVLSYRPKPQTLKRWQPLADYLNQQVQGVNLQLQPLFMDEMQEAVAQGEVDFIFTQPSHYVLLTYRNQLSSPLAMLVNNEAGVPVASFAGSILVPQESSIHQFKDLRGLRLATPQVQSLGAYQMQAFELQQAGLRAGRDYHLLEVGMPQDRVIQALLQGEADAGFVRSGVLDALLAQGALPAASLRVLEPKQHADFPFEVSTRLYPEWPLVSLPGVDPLIVRQVAAALFAIPLNGELAQQMDIAGFTVPGDYRSIDELLYQLKLPPFEHLNEFDLVQAWQQWQPEGGVLLALLILLLAVGLGLLWQRNRELYIAHGRLQASGEEINRLSQAMEQSPEGVLITDQSARIEYVNPAFEVHTGYSKQELLGKNPSLLASGQTSKKTYQSLWQQLSKGQVWRGEFINRRKDASEYLVSVLVAPIRNRNNEVTHFLAIEQDVTEKRAAEERLHQLAYYDSLTQLPNRSLQLDRVGEVLRASQKSGQLAALILINVDRFKLINDARGNQTGDQLLMALARRLLRQLPEGASLARMGADEFSLLLKDLGPRPSQASRAVLDVLQSIQWSLRKPFDLDNQLLRLTVSLGITLLPEQEAETTSTVLARADTALHRAKGRGGNRYRFYEEFMGRQVVQVFNLENDLRRALEQEQLQVYLQPQFNQQQVRVGAEALLRWQHPQQGWISPSEFVPVAEHSDLIVALDRWVVEQVLDFLEQQQEKGTDWQVSVNISPRHFAQQDFATWLQNQLQGRRVQPHQIQLELTEGVLIDDVQATVSTMNQLAASGFRFALDDFGTGYSSLAYIKNLPLHELKIDRAFVQDAFQKEADAVLVRSILAVARCMHLQVVVEGVETQQQLDFFAEETDVIYQGYFFARPQPLTAF